MNTNLRFFYKNHGVSDPVVYAKQGCDEVLTLDNYVSDIGNYLWWRKKHPTSAIVVDRGSEVQSLLDHARALGVSELVDYTVGEGNQLSEQAWFVIQAGYKKLFKSATTDAECVRIIQTCLQHYRWDILGSLKPEDRRGYTVADTVHARRALGELARFFD